MCLVISVILGILAFNFFMAGKAVLAIFSVLGSIGFIVLMVKNILHVKSLKQKESEK
jgi:hypothetical protein